MTEIRRAFVYGLLSARLRKRTVREAYLVGIGDTLRSIALRHPQLNDPQLWLVVAAINGFATTTDATGRPTAVLCDGETILIPNPDDIEEFYYGSDYNESHRLKFPRPS